MTAAALILVVGALALVRLGWGGWRGAAPAGWALAAAAIVWLAALAGAWGVAVGTTTGIAAALAMVLHAGWRSPARVQRPARVAPALVLPRRWSGVARRVAVFLLVVPAAFAAAQWLAFGAQALARAGGAGDADATVLAMMLQPVSWGALMAWQMTRAGPAGMIAPPVLAALLGTALWGAA